MAAFQADVPVAAPEIAAADEEGSERQLAMEILEDEMHRLGDLRRGLASERQRLRRRKAMLEGETQRFLEAAKAPADGAPPLVDASATEVASATAEGAQTGPNAIKADARPIEAGPSVFEGSSATEAPLAPTRSFVAMANARRLSTHRDLARVNSSLSILEWREAHLEQEERVIRGRLGARNESRTLNARLLELANDMGDLISELRDVIADEYVPWPLPLRQHVPHASPMRRTFR